MSEIYFRIKEFITEYYWIAGIPIMIWGVILVTTEKNDINQNLNETFGMVYGSRSIYKQYSKRHYRYEFFFNGKKYTGSSIGYTSDKVEKGKFYKVEFSNKNPKHSRMIFDLEYTQRLEMDKNGKVIDTIYISKDQELRNKIKGVIYKYEIKIDSVKTKHNKQ